MEKTIPFSSIFIELDALLDTRIGTIANMNINLVEDILKDGYYTRIADSFKGIELDEFKFRYDNRTKSVLKDSMVTPMINMITEFANKLLANIVTSPNHYLPRVIINIHPYKLTEDEIVTIISIVRAATKGKLDISVVDMSYEEITVSYVKRNIAIMVLYEYNKWLDIQAANDSFKKNSCPDVILFGPAIYFKEPPKTPFKHEENPFTALETLAAPLIGLKLLSIDTFSLIIRPKDKT